jgi:hypothetical protein
MLTRTYWVASTALLMIAAPAAGGLFVPEPETHLMEMKRAAPDWWTPDLIAEVDRASDAGLWFNPFDHETVAPAAAPAGGVPVAPDYLLIRPGALFLGSSGALCTYNFVYASATKIGTAGHCVEKVGERVYILAAPTVPIVFAVGTVSAFKNAGVGNDWALITIDPQWSLFVDPNMAYLGGPSCPVWSPSLSEGKTVGHGIQTGLVAAVPRVHTVLAWDGRSFNGAGEISGGDSGSPLVQVNSPLPGCVAGAAIGVLTHCSTITGIECLPLFYGTDIRRVPATVTAGLDPV